MKKKISISLLISVVISVILLVINRICAAITGHIVGMTIPGGDCIEKIGFGWYELTVYGEMTAEQAASWSPKPDINFDILSFGVTTLILFIIVLVICVLTRKKL